MNIVNQMLLTVILFCASVILVVAIVSPDQFGNWLQEIDNARYEFIGE